MSRSSTSPIKPITSTATMMRPRESELPFWNSSQMNFPAPLQHQVVGIVGLRVVCVVPLAGIGGCYGQRVEGAGIGGPVADGRGGSCIVEVVGIEEAAEVTQVGAPARHQSMGVAVKVAFLHAAARSLEDPVDVPRIAVVDGESVCGVSKGQCVHGLLILAPAHAAQEALASRRALSWSTCSKR